MIHAKKKDHAMNLPAVSVAFSGEDNNPRPHSPNGLPDIRDSDDPAEEKIRLMQDVKRLDEEVLGGLIRGLKIPMPNLNSPPSNAVFPHWPVHVSRTCASMCPYATLAITLSQQSINPSSSNSLNISWIVSVLMGLSKERERQMRKATEKVEGEGERDHLHRALNPPPPPAPKGGRESGEDVCLEGEWLEMEGGGEEAERTPFVETSLCTSLKGGRRASRCVPRLLSPGCLLSIRSR